MEAANCVEKAGWLTELIGNKTLLLAQRLVAGLSTVAERPRCERITVLVGKEDACTKVKSPTLDDNEKQ